MRAIASLAVALFVCAAVSAQDNAVKKPDSAVAHARAISVFGRVSSDAKTLFTDLDSEWEITNAALLKGYEGHLVRVKCYVDSQKNKIEVISVKRDDADLQYAARRTDSAFRR